MKDNLEQLYESAVTSAQAWLDLATAKEEDVREITRGWINELADAENARKAAEDELATIKTAYARCRELTASA